MASSLSSQAFRIWLSIGSAVPLAAALFLIFFVFWGAHDFITSVDWFSALFKKDWYPQEGLYGMAPLLLGTLEVSALAILLATPIAGASALALVIFLPRHLAGILQMVIETLSSIPPVVVGLFGLLTLVPWIGQWAPPGVGLLTASLVLGFLLTPHFIILMAEAIRPELDELQLVARTLGLSRITFVWRVLWPMRRRSLGRALRLMIGRALGETLAVLMVAGNAVQIPSGPFSSFRTLNATIALEMPYASEIHASALFFLGCLTFLTILGLWTTSFRWGFASIGKSECEP